MSRHKKNKTQRRQFEKPAGSSALSINGAFDYLPDYGARDWNTPVSLRLDEVKAHFGPPYTLAGPNPAEVRHALDGAIDRCGGYSLIQHALEMGQGGFGSQFMGYPALASFIQNGLISACVTTLADDMTREWCEYKRSGQTTDSNDDGEDELLEFVRAEDKRLGLEKVFHGADQMMAQYGGCLVYLDTGASDDELALPLTEVSADLLNNGLKRLTLVEPLNCSPADVNTTNPLAPDFYKPETWWIMTRKVHASRLIKITGVEPPQLLKPAYNFLGIPHAQILYDYVLHFNECRIAVQRLIKKFSLTIFQTNMKEILYQNGGLEQLQRRVKLFVNKRSNDGVHCIDKESEEIVKLETPLSGLDKIVTQALELIAAIDRKPAVKLLGISPSGFNATGESDITNYYDHISSQQEKINRPGHERIIRLCQIHKFGKADPSLTFEYNPLADEDEKVIADTQGVKADTGIKLVTAGVITAGEERVRLAADPMSGYSNLEIDENGEGGSFEAEINSILEGASNGG